MLAEVKDLKKEAKIDFLQEQKIGIEMSIAGSLDPPLNILERSV
jgi:hypothetical protein